jgi:hypothetical protein
MLNHRLVLAITVSACSSAHTATAPADSPRARCYAGPSQIRLMPDDRPVGEGTIVARRTTDPAHATITEDVTTTFPGQPVRSFAVTMAVSGSTFQMTERGGAFTGSGVLVGPAWAWTEWTSTSKLPDGTVVTATDRTTPTGFAGDKTVASADGVARVKITETVTEIDCADFDRRVAAAK